ncbi:hypothetical protein F0562_025573 [Nyssa sinensis]|uniref:Uncharacterized protein n=1 Tax=Nyssa sinensis TaxID=561372 RepID=A0A5J5BCE0_9ASTE|nr:hypothetical protein F0562_025573 [Nyssa sinensis]
MSNDQRTMKMPSELARKLGRGLIRATAPHHVAKSQSNPTDYAAGPPFPPHFRQCQLDLKKDGKPASDALQVLLTAPVTPPVSCCELSSAFALQCLLHFRQIPQAARTDLFALNTSEFSSCTKELLYLPFKFNPTSKLSNSPFYFGSAIMSNDQRTMKMPSELARKLGRGLIRATAPHHVAKSQSNPTDYAAGLNIDFDQVRVQVLGKESLPSLEGVFSIVRAEESRRGVMLDNPVNEGSAMNSTKLGHHTEINRDERQPNREGVWCTYCKKARHTKDTCWKLHGKPPNVGGKGGNRGGQPRGQAHMTNAEDVHSEKPNQDGLETLKEEIEKLKSMLNSGGKPGSSCSLTQSEPTVQLKNQDQPAVKQPLNQDQPTPKSSFDQPCDQPPEPVLKSSLDQPHDQPLNQSESAPKIPLVAEKPILVYSRRKEPASIQLQVQDSTPEPGTLSGSPASVDEKLSMFGEEESSRAVAVMLQQQQQRTTIGKREQCSATGKFVDPIGQIEPRPIVYFLKVLKDDKALD